MTGKGVTTGKEVHAMTDVDVAHAIENAHQELFNLRFQDSIGQLANTSRHRQVRRNLARLLTVQRERAIWAQFEGEEG